MQINPIAQRLSMLSDQWASFAERARARMLCWQLTADECSMFEAFIELESDERTAEHATLFVTLDTQFAAPEQHGRHLSETLAQGIAEGQDELEALGLPSGWKLPTPLKQETDQAYLLRCCESLLGFFEVRSELALILRPRAVTDFLSYEQWLLELAAQAPEGVRFVVLDDADAPAFVQWRAPNTPRVVCQRANLDMANALLGLSDAAGNLDTPGGKFRDLFVRMGNALRAGQLEQALRDADAAVEVARTQGLWHLAVPVHVAVAAAMLTAGHEEDSLARYAAAEAVAQAGTEQEDPALSGLCKKLLLQSRMAHGAGLAGLQQWTRAAGLFEQSVPLAAAEQDSGGVLDCHRLASFCYEQSGDAARAWQAALLGLAAARELEPSARESSNLASLAVALQRMAAGHPAKSVEPVLDQLAQLLGSKDQPAAVSRSQPRVS